MHWTTIVPMTALLVTGCPGQPSEPTAPTALPPPPASAPTATVAHLPLPDPRLAPTPGLASGVSIAWSPGLAVDGRFELYEDWISTAQIDAMQGREVGVWIAAAGEPELRWTCTSSQVGARGEPVRGLGSGRPRSVVALAPAPPLPMGPAACFAITPDCDDEGFPAAWPWGHETATMANLPDANGDGNPEWATTLYVYPEVEILFGFGGSDQARADCSVLVGG